MRVRYTRRAAADLSEVLDYIAERSPSGARNVKVRIRKAERMLALFPQIGERGPIPWLRRVTAAPYPYLIFYEIREDEVWILGIRHAARDSWPGS